MRFLVTVYGVYEVDVEPSSRSIDVREHRLHGGRNSREEGCQLSTGVGYWQVVVRHSRWMLTTAGKV